MNRENDFISNTLMVLAIICLVWWGIKGMSYIKSQQTPTVEKPIRKNNNLIKTSAEKEEDEGELLSHQVLVHEPSDIEAEGEEEDDNEDEEIIYEEVKEEASEELINEENNEEEENNEVFSNEAPLNETTSEEQTRSDELEETTDSPSYHVIAGSFKYADNAEKEVKRLKALGFSDAQVVQFASTKYSSVSIGLFDNEKDAEALVKKLKAKKVRAYVHKRRFK